MSRLLFLKGDKLHWASGAKEYGPKSIRTYMKVIIDSQFSTNGLLTTQVIVLVDEANVLVLAQPMYYKIVNNE